MKGFSDELQVFKYVGDQIPDNAWPEFRLSDVLVFRGDETSLASLLLVGTRGAVTVRGVLGLLRPEQHDNLRDGRIYTSPGAIELHDVSRFAYGTVEGTDNIAIWAAGKAGWFLIEPSAVYAHIYQHMVVAVKMFHFLEDQYRPYRKGKRRFKGTMKQLFAMYAEAQALDTGSPGLSEGDVKALFSEHRDFLIFQMFRLGGWGRTGISRYLKNEHPRDFSRIGKLATKFDERNDGDPSTGSSTLTAECRPFELDSLQEFSPGQENQHLVVWDLMTTVQRERRLPLGMMTTDGFAKFVFGCFDIRDLATAALLIEACAKELVELMLGTAGDPFNWTKRKIYKELNGAVISEEDRKRVLGLLLRRRADSPMPENDDATEEEQTSDAEETTNRSRGIGQKSGKGRSTLRPSAIGTMRAATPVNRSDDGDDGDDDHNEVKDVVLAVREGKRKALNNPASRKMRRCNSIQSSQSGDQTTEAENTGSTKTQSPKLQLKITKQQPFAQPQRGGYLHCSVDSCNYKVYCTDRTGFDTVINQHLRTEHEKFARILDILDSESKVDQPLSELKGKVRKMAARETDSPAIGDDKTGGFGPAQAAGKANDVGTHDRGFEDFANSLYSKPPRGRY
ncbi:MAG: hypothetical protein M1839_001645 [Geoglossum umbratile]|nr:MAG: hypothetical protein M1839_001645 [Geoglossum umbratile]